MGDVINKVLDYFQRNEDYPGDDWAFDDEYKSLSLDFRGKYDGAIFWLDIDRAGYIKLVWKPKDGPHESVKFVPQS